MVSYAKFTLIAAITALGVASPATARSRSRSRIPGAYREALIDAGI
jgi:hypothetical protein